MTNLQSLRGGGTRRPSPARADDGRPRRRGFRLTGRAAVLALVLCALVVALAYPTREYISQRAQIRKARAEHAKQESTVRDLRRLKARWQDPAFVITQARQRLHYVMPGELGFVMRQPKSSTGSHGSGAGDQPWYDNMWDGLDSADSDATSAGPPSAALTPAPRTGRPATSIR